MGSCDRIVQHRTSRAQGSGLSEGGPGVSVSCSSKAWVQTRGLASPHSLHPQFCPIASSAGPKWGELHPNSWQAVSWQEGPCGFSVLQRNKATGGESPQPQRP